MMKLKICYNISNITKCRVSSFPTYFLIVDEEENRKIKAASSWKLFIEAGIGFETTGEYFFLSEKFNKERYITIGDNGTSTRIVKDPDKEESKLLLKFLQENSPGILNNYLDIILDQIVE